jgi:hypothetical protein
VSPAYDRLRGVIPWTLTGIESAVRASWSIETCSPDDLADWHPGNPARGHCDVTALVLHDLLGGDLVCAEVHVAGSRRGYHWWNRLATGVEIDLTREQFHPRETIVGVRLVSRPAGPPRRRGEEYALFRGRVLDRLGPLPGSGSAGQRSLGEPSR